MGKLDGKIAVITGGTAGIGLATAKLFAAEGAKVIVTGRDEAALDAARQSIGHGVEAVRSDATRLADIDALGAHIADRHGRVDIVFANAGAVRPRMFEDVTEDDFNFEVAANFKSSYFTVQKLLPIMTSGGAVIFNSSVNGVKGAPTMGLYGAMKAALRSLARTLTAELSDRGVRVNALAPGFTETDMGLKAGATEETMRQARAHVHAQIPMHRSAMPEDIAKAALFLACDDSSYITGVELHVDGGWVQV